MWLVWFVCKWCRISIFILHTFLECYFKDRHFHAIENGTVKISSDRCFKKKVFAAALVSPRCKSTSPSQQLPLQTPARLAVVFAQVLLPGRVLSCARKANRSHPPHSISPTLPPIVNAPSSRPSLVLCVYCLPALARSHWLRWPLPGNGGSRVYFCRLASGGGQVPPSLAPVYLNGGLRWAQSLILRVQQRPCLFLR